MALSWKRCGGEGGDGVATTVCLSNCVLLVLDGAQEPVKIWEDSVELD